jgi:Asp/Glu/hydantoin racemase
MIGAGPKVEDFAENRRAYGAGPARLGILMLETRFPRILGDIGNPETWPFPATYRVVSGASAERVVRRRAEGLREAFCEAAEALVAEGVAGIATTCGFLSLFQDALATRCGVPVAASSLMQVPFVQRMLPPGHRVGIVTISASTLTPKHLSAAGVPLDTPVAGTEGGRVFSRAILQDEPELDVAAAEQDILEAGAALLRAHPEVGAVVLECTNMAPYAHALQSALDRPVFDIYSFLTWFHAGLAPRNFVATAEAGMWNAQEARGP